MSIRERICRIARCHPQDLGEPFTVWSLAKLADYLITQGVVDRISKETLRQILKDHGINWQATKTWKASNDPEFRPKMDALPICMITRRLMGTWCVLTNSGH
jgi:hypothetical protein